MTIALRILAQSTRFACLRTKAARVLLVLASAVATPAGAHMDRLADDEMASVSGSGIAIGLDNFQWAMAPSSYFEQVGNAPSNNCTATGNVAGNWNCWRRGDLRWYGINISAASGAVGPYQWDDSTTCDPTTLDCPRGGAITNFAPYDNPYIIRAWSPTGLTYGTFLVPDPNNPPDVMLVTTSQWTNAKSIFEFLAPTQQPYYTFSFWGEIEAGSTRDPATQTLATNAGSILKSQTIIRGNAAGSIFRMFTFPDTGDGSIYSSAFAFFYHSRLQGDFRFSVAQAASGNDTIGQPTVFAPTEGLFFRNVKAFVPLGQLYYQAIEIGPVGTSGNFFFELTPIPNLSSVYSVYYGINGAVDSTGYGYETARYALPSASNPTGTATSYYLLSHGYSRWGGWYPGLASGRNAINLQTDGIYFNACSICSTFYAFADRPIRIDKRGPTQSMQQTQNYNCSTGNAGGCAATPTSGPIVSGPGDSTKTYPTTTVNLGDSRIEGLLINRLRFESCAAGGC